MFAARKQNPSAAVEDHSDHQYYGTKLKSRRYESSENQPSNPLEPDPEITACVEARHLSFHYKSSNPILNDINLTVPKGKIYALLGASGCGKTTLLRMILGQRKPLSGTVMVFGKRPGTPESHIPGPGVGYMPQDLALFTALSIEENFVYFGSLHGLSRSTIETRLNQLIELLDLPDKKRIVGKLSGGQQRRLSLAVSMIHRPPLLILDEPTVGVDPLLRQKIWNYLENLCAQHGITVMLTTHYTEEAIDAYRVGFIYSGSMLAEENPQTLLLKYQCRTLEDVFLELCLEQENNMAAKPESESRAKVAPSLAISKSDIPKESEDDKQQMRNISKLFSTVRLRAKLNNYYHATKSIWTLFIFLFIVMPTFEAALYGIFLVKHFGHIPVAVVNEEQQNNNNNSSHSLSNLFIEKIDQNLLDLHYYNDLDEGINAIHSNQARMVVRFRSNFSRYFRRRFLQPEKITEKVVNNSKIELYADTSNNLFYIYSYQTLMNAFMKYTRSVGDMFGHNPNSWSAPFKTYEPIYGTMSLNYFGIFLPGMIIVSLHGKCFIWSSTLVIRGKKEGYLERESVAGLTIEEYLLSFIMLSSVIIIILNLEMMFMIYFVFGATSVGPLWHIFIVNFLACLQALCFGLVPSVVGRTMIQSILLGVFMELTLPFSCCCFWPIESLPMWLRKILIWNPLTMLIQSAQNIMFRGWSLMRFEVFQGMLYCTCLTVLFLVFSIVYFRMFK